jgi:beta-galactosidase
MSQNSLSTTLTALPKFFLHGGDYNPEQWDQNVWREDIKLMCETGVNSATIGVFSWAALEPADGVYNFDRFDEVVGLLSEAGMQICLATPSGARPPWLSQKYPEVLRVAPENFGARNLFGRRHNHCFTSPVYRRKVAGINGRLAQRYGNLRNVVLWHLSNEYNGACHCELCQNAFREWLRQKYKTLDALNHAWWSAFWSHTYADWSQINAPEPRGEMLQHGLTLDWKRFTTAQTIDFMKHEIAAIREFDKKTPVTTNLMGAFPGLDYFKLARELDYVSWDAYPAWHSDPKDETGVASQCGFLHDLNRSFSGGRPFLLMENTPSSVNWKMICKPKKPGMHKLASMQAIAHGSDSIQYFQWRKSRGSAEKFHGAVIGHGHARETRVFRDVCEVGEILKKLRPIANSVVKAQVAILYDWENRWAYEDAHGLNKARKNYPEDVNDYYRAFWNESIPVDVIDEDCDLSGYRVIVLPVAYMIRENFAAGIRQFVQNGGALVVSHSSGIADESDLVFENGQPGPLSDALGIWVEENFPLLEKETVKLLPDAGGELASGLAKASYDIMDLSELVHLTTAESIASYGDVYFAGAPCLTKNKFGAGVAYYISGRVEKNFLDEFLPRVAREASVESAWVFERKLPAGVQAQIREDAEPNAGGTRGRYLFLMNWMNAPQTVPLPANQWVDLLNQNSGEKDRIQTAQSMKLEPLGVRVFKI